jgi:uncharacterized spore protein YtfJ
MDDLQALVERLEKISEEVNVDAVFGKPQTIEGRVLIPVAELSYGFAMGVGSGPSCTCACHGEGEGDAETEPCCDEEACACCEEEGGMATGGGGGAGAKARPIAYIDVGPEGAHVQPIIDDQKVALAGILLGAWAIGWVGLVLKTLFTRRA